LPVRVASFPDNYSNEDGEAFTHLLQLIADDAVRSEFQERSVACDLIGESFFN
jgi:hypothetical protein